MRYQVMYLVLLLCSIQSAVTFNFQRSSISHLKLSFSRLWGSIQIVNDVANVKKHERLIDGLRMRRLPRSDIVVSELGVGTCNFGEQVNQADAHAQLDLAIDQYGLNYIETSEVYPMPYTAETIGASNKIVGEWLKKRSPQKRSELVINANICGYNEGIDWTLRRKHDPTIDWKCTDLSRKQMIAAVDTQLQQLGVEQIDILSLMWPERYCATLGQREYVHSEERTEKETTSIFNQLETLQELIKSGKIRAFGLSNETPYGLGCFSTMAKLLNLPQPTITTQPLNLLNRYETEKGILEACSQSEIAFVACSPLAGGALSGKYLKHHSYNMNSRLLKYLGHQYRYIAPAAVEVVKKLHQFAEESYLPLAPCALGWVYHRPFVSSTLISATSLRQLEENIWGLNAYPYGEDMEDQIEALYTQNVDPIRGPFQVIDPTKEYFDPGSWTTKEIATSDIPSQYIAYNTDVEDGELTDVE